MAPFNIAKFPEPVLAKKSKSIELVTGDERDLLDKMLETMYLNQGIGLAAPQVGISKRAIVVDVGEGPISLINPIVVEKKGQEISKEGCLSLPEVTVEVKRAEWVKYRGLDREGKLIENEAGGLLARAIQHEIDHLDGRLIIDYANPIKRIFIKRRLIRNRQA
ncbi:MAG: peptide deformylase [Candidatus Omnitrophota bacterium]